MNTALNSTVFTGLNQEEKALFGQTVLVSDLENLYKAEDRYVKRLLDQSLLARERARIEGLLKTVRGIIDRKIEITGNFYNVPSLVIVEKVEKAIESIPETIVEPVKEKKQGKIISMVQKFVPGLSKEEQSVATAVEQQLFEHTETAQEKAEEVVNIKSPVIEFDRSPVLTNEALMPSFSDFVIKDQKLYYKESEITSLQGIEQILVGLRDTVAINVLRNFYLDLLQHPELKLTDNSSKLQQNVISAASRFENLVVKYKESRKPAQKVVKPVKVRSTFNEAKALVIASLKESSLEEATKLANQLFRKDCVLDEATKKPMPPYGSTTIDGLIAAWIKEENIVLEQKEQIVLPSETKIILSKDQFEMLSIEQITNLFTSTPKLNNLPSVLSLLKHLANLDQSRKNDAILFAKKVLPGMPYISIKGEKVVISDKDVEMIIEEIATNSGFSHGKSLLDLINNCNESAPFFDSEEAMTNLAAKAWNDISEIVTNGTKTVAAAFKAWMNEHNPNIITPAALLARVIKNSKKGTAEEIKAIEPVVTIEKGLLFERSNIATTHTELWDDASVRVTSFDSLVAECKAILSAHDWVVSKNFALDCITQGLVPEAKDFTLALSEDWFDKFILNEVKEQKEEIHTVEPLEDQTKEAIIAAAEEAATQPVKKTVIKDLKVIEQMIKDAIAAGNNTKDYILQEIVMCASAFNHHKNTKQANNWLNKFLERSKLQLA